jgi:hypothetical protein
MIFPFDCEDLFELNDNLQPYFDGEVIVIDDIFKNFKDILDICYNLPVEKWKISPNSRNFIDYYDCRPKFENFYPNKEKIDKRLKTLFSITDYFFNLKGKVNSDKSFVFNYFKNLKLNVSNNFQHYPHRDKYYNCIIYIDPFKNGGTALYESQNIKNDEHINLLYDISKLKIKKQIQSIPNRCAIFPGNILHGGYIKDHNIYYYNWRINLTHFFNNI